MMWKNWAVASLLLPLMLGNGTNRNETDTEAPGFDETRDFILRRTATVWGDGVGGTHQYQLRFVDKKLRLTRRYTSKFEPGFTQRMDVELRYLDPDRVQSKEETAHLITLSATDDENRISIETTYDVPTDWQTVQKTTARSLFVPGSVEGSVDAQVAMNGRLRKAWSHLIRLAGGKPSRKEPF